MWDKIARNALSNIASTAISLAVGFALMPLIVHHIGPSQFGIWMLVNGLVGYMGLVDLGLGPTLVKKSAEHLASEAPAARDSLNRMVSSVFVLYVALGAVAGAGLALLTALPEGTFNVPEKDIGTFRIVLLIVGLQTAINFPMSVWTGLLGGLQDFHYANLLGILTNLIRVVTTIWILETGHGLVALVWMGFAISIVAWAARWWWIRRRIPFLRISFASFDRKESLGLARFSGAMVIWSLAGYAVHQMDKVIIGIMLPVALITTYEIGARINLYARNVAHSWLSVVMPAASGLSAQGNEEMLRKLYLAGTKYLLITYAGAVVALFGFGREFIRLWMGSEFDGAVTVLYVLLAGSLFQSVNLVAHVMLPGMGRLRVFTRIMIGYVALSVVLGAAFTKVWGVIGMAAAISVTMMVMETIFVRFILIEFGVRFGTFAKACLYPMFIASIPAIGWILIAKRWSPATNWPLLVLDVGICLSLYVITFWRVALTAAERRALVNRVSGALGRGKPTRAENEGA